MRVSKDTLLAFVVGGLAVALASAGTAVAATGSLVNIADPTNAAYLAKVSSAGKLLTQVSGSVTSKIDPTGNTVALAPGGTVGIDPAANTVGVVTSPSSPLHVREDAAVFGDTSTNLVVNAGAVLCTPLELADGRLVRLEAVTVSAGGPATPIVWLQLWGESSASSGSGLAQELAIPLTAQSTSFFNFSGSLRPGLIVQGGSEFAADGIPARVSFCVRGSASGSNNARFTASGVYLDA